MKTLFRIFLISQFIYSPLAFAQFPSLNWVDQIGGKYDDEGNGVAIDGNGNILVTGMTNDSTTFYSTNGTAVLNDTAVASFFTVAKYDPAGNLLWNFKLGSHNINRGIRIFADANNDAIVLGSYSDTIDVDPDAAIQNFYFGNNSPFVAKYISSGQLLWSFGFDSLGLVANDIAVSAGGEIFLAGNFNQTVDFDPGPGITTLTSQGLIAAFIAKYDANGNFQWAKSWGGISAGGAYHVMTDTSGDSYISGTFSDSVDFDPGPGVFFMQGTDDTYVMKLDQYGLFQWSFNLGDSIKVLKITQHISGEILLTGNFSGTADFDPGAGVYDLTSNGAADIYVACYSSSGLLLWAKSMGGIKPDGGIDIASNAPGNMYLTGAFQNDVDFDPGIGVTTLSSNGEDDIFIAAYDPSFNLIWVFNVGDSLWDNPSAMVLDNDGSLIAVGQFMHHPDFNPGAGVDSAHFSCCRDIFIAKYSSSDLNGIATIDAKDFLPYPNPFTSWLNLEIENLPKGNHLCCISDALGVEQVFSFSTGEASPLTFKLNSLATGIYLLELRNPGGQLICSKKIIKQ